MLKAPDLATAISAVTVSQAAPNGFLVDYHLDRGNGLDAIAELSRRFGADLPAILITADRSPHVRETARAQDVQVAAHRRALQPRGAVPSAGSAPAGPRRALAYPLLALLALVPLVPALFLPYLPTVD